MTRVSKDFIFGTLSTDRQRLAFYRAELSEVSHQHRVHPLDPLPGQEVCLTVTLGPRIVADHVTCYFTTDDTLPGGHLGQPTSGSQSVACTRTASVWNTFLWGYLDEWQCFLPSQMAGTTVRYCIEAWSSLTGASVWAGEIIGNVAKDAVNLDDTGPEYSYLEEPGEEFDLIFVRHDRTFAYRVDQEAPPEWLRDALIYHIFVDRFNPGDGKPFLQAVDQMDFYGGTLRGIIEQLDYVTALGATAIWLSPVFPSPSHHGYDAIDYGSIEPRLGTMEDMRTLIDAAHERGLRVLLDYTANHISANHPLFQEALHDPASPYRDWFTFVSYPDLYLAFFGLKNLPQVNNDHPDARRSMIDQAVFWLQQGVDGFRLDYALGPSHSFWTDFRAATRESKPDSVTIGEAVATDEGLRTYLGRLDGCLDFLLLQAIREFFAFGTITASQFDSFVQRHIAAFEPGFVLPSFLDNHDMNRFLWIVQGDVRRLKLAALCQFTLPHPPIVYYGTEVGLSQIRDVRYEDESGHPEESRLPMIWGETQDRELLHFYQQLGQLRRATAPLWRCSRRTLHLDDDHGVYAYLCADERAETVVHEPLLVVLNNNAAPQHVPLPTDQAWELVLASESPTEVDATVMLPPYGGAVLRPRED